MNHRAKPLPAERQFVRPAHWVAPQGRPAWQARRFSAEPTVVRPGELDSAESCYQRDPSPPPYPWRELGTGLAVVFMVLGVVHLVASVAPQLAQVAAR